MQSLQDSLSNHLTLEEILARLEKARVVDGLALFGSRKIAPTNPVSDYDLLILVADPPVRIFQMLTHIAGRMADVVFVETAMADALLEDRQPVAAVSFEGMFLQKMLSARIVYDASDRLARVQRYAQAQHPANRLLLPSTESDLYSVWFWFNQSLIHLKRMIQADDPVYLTAVDLMLMGGLSGICRAYFQVRHLAWEGEKAAIRYLQSADPAFLDLLHACIAQTDRAQKLALYEQLVAQALAPVGTLWTHGLTAVFLSDAPQSASRLESALQFWQDLLEDR